MNQKKRPIGITLLALFAGIAALIAIVNTLQMLHLLPIRGPFGQFAFFTFNLGGAILWGILALIYIWVIKMLWSVNAQGWLFLVLLTILNLIMAGVSLIGNTPWQALVPTLLINGLILIYCLLPGTKTAFQVEQLKQLDPAPAAAMAKAASPEPESAPEPTPTMVENVDIAAETAVVAATISAQSEPEPVIEEGVEVVEMAEVIEVDSSEVAVEDVEEIEIVATVVENVDIEAETAVAAATIAAAAELAEEVEEPGPTAVDLVKETAHSSPGESAKLAATTEFIEGIGPAYSQKLKEASIETAKDILEKGATRQGRHDLAEETGISSKLILKWVHAADLYRVKGVGKQYADLLDKAGVNTVLELAQRNPDNLHEKLIEVNLEKHLVREVPSQNNVKDWIEQAAALPRVISY